MIRKARTICGGDRGWLIQLVAVISSQQSDSRQRSGRSGGHRSSGSNSSISMAATSHRSEVEDRDSSSEAEGLIWSSRSGHRTEKLRRVRMEFPRFSRENPCVWLDRTRQYFAAQDRRFEKGLLVRFGSSEYEDANEAMNKLREKGAFREYLGECERLMNTLPHWHPSALLGAFMAGLKEEIAGDLRMWRLKDLQTAIEIAKRKDEQLQRAWRAGGGSARSGFRTATGGAGTQVIEEDEGEAVEEPLTEETEHISIHALTRQVNYKTIRFGGRIGRQKVQVLLDSGASLNFTGPPMAERLKLIETGQQPFAVWAANGERLLCNRRYEGIILGVQGVEFKVTLYALPVIGVEVVIGVPWLEQLSPTVTDYKEMTMEFGAEDKRHILRGAVPEGTRAVEA
ncbi:hypothetical protein CRG98_001340 [Punica granatum]|uniref:Retrotransposon gag domain-containing protein n=1 Tax=Punica granatum TaxID=22663 RepID=A0A2I0LC80_PUNGR|nr:hypothetical protein CRG98_001340 [Punica granatum]